jgi:DNA polymerase-4
VVCAASYEARQFGVRSAMPASTAQRLCPAGIFLRPRMDSYVAESRLVMQIVQRLAGDLIQQVSIDEAYVDVTAYSFADSVDQRLEIALPLARRLKNQIRVERRLTASVGIASNKLLAKLASDMEKPDGLTLIRESEKVSLLRPLPIRSLHGVGPVTERALAEVGIKTVGDLQDYRGELRTIVGSWGDELRRFAFGQDDRELDLSREAKSIGSEQTFLDDTADRVLLRKCLWDQAKEIATRLEEKQLIAHTVHVKVRYSDFRTLTRQVSLEEPVSRARELYRLGCWLLARERLVNQPLRLLGLGVSGLGSRATEQLSLPLARQDVDWRVKTRV